MLSQSANNGLLTTVCCALRVRALPSAIACSLIFRISSTLPTYRGVTLLDRPAALRPRAGKDKLVWRLPLDSSTGKCHRCSVCASPSAHRADTEYSSTKRDGHVPPVPVTARTDRVRVTPSPHPGMGCLSFQETVTIVFSHIGAEDPTVSSGITMATPTRDLVHTCDLRDAAHSAVRPDPSAPLSLFWGGGVRRFRVG